MHYFYLMKFEWDPVKSRANQKKHGIDFETAKEIWDDPDCIVIRAPYPLEDRNIIIGRLKEKIWTGIYTMRGASVRIISVRRSRRKEEKLYGQEKVRNQQ